MQENKADQILLNALKEQEKNAQKQMRENEIQEAAEAVMYALEEYRASIWCEVLAHVVLGVFSAHLEATEINRENTELREEMEKI